MVRSHICQTTAAKRHHAKHDLKIKELKPHSLALHYYENKYVRFLHISLGALLSAGLIEQRI